ncbi:MAG: hypothetical protein J6A04_01935 [Clostridia bacterium]|nr:hypothetical protein [Clostridia bacterium]
MDENLNDKKTYQVIDMSENETKSKKTNNTFSKSVLLPFVSGAIGATLVIGTCFGIPQIRDTIFQNTKLIETSATSRRSAYP